MSLHYLKVTIASTGVAQALGASLPAGSLTRAKEVTIQNNTAAAFNIGDATVTGVSANPSLGIRLDPTGSSSASISHIKFGPTDAYNQDLNSIYINGTATNHADVLYVL